MKIVVGSDHRGIYYKSAVAEALRRLSESVSVYEIGPTVESTSVDYPTVVAEAVAKFRKVDADFCVLICGSGFGVNMAANRFLGMRAATCRTTSDARACRNHNNANTICIGSDFTDLNGAIAIIKTFIATPFDGGERHRRRIELLDS